MAMDFTVIQPVRQRFGDGRLEEATFEEAPFVGKSKDFPFSCPGIDRGQMAVLQFESLAVSAGLNRTPRNILQINGIDIPGGITAGPFFIHNEESVPVWKSHSLIIDANILKIENVLHIESISVGFGTNFDDFIIDNVVVFFKTRGRVISNQP